MNISRAEQRTLHALARGGRIQHFKDERGCVIAVECITREGWRLTDCTLETWRKLKKRRLIQSRDGGAYRITREGLSAVRPQLDNRA